MLSRYRLLLASLALLVLWLGAAPAARADTFVIVVRSAAGPTVASIVPAVEQFRADLGGALNPNVAGSFGSGRREINWDGVPNAFSAPNNLPGNFFNSNSPRGAVLSTPGTGLQVSATSASGVPVEFGNLDPSYPSAFNAFTPERLFTALGSNVVDVNFFVPGTTTSALVSGFGSVFTDVDLPNTTSIEYFGAGGESLGVFFAPASAGDGRFSFLGVSFGSAVVSRVRITSGNAAPGAGVTDQNGNPRDVVVMDDFIYGEPQAVQAVPEPATLLLFGTGVAGVIGAARRRRKASRG